MTKQLPSQETPASYPKDSNGHYWPLDADAALDWLKTASPDDLDWYYRLLLG